MDPVPPSKQYLKIGEVARLTRLNPSVLRFWETEFAVLRPLKSRTGQRLYSKGDLELVLWIKQLLYRGEIDHCRCQNQACESVRQDGGEPGERIGRGQKNTDNRRGQKGSG